MVMPSTVNPNEFPEILLPPTAVQLELKKISLTLPPCEKQLEPESGIGFENWQF